MSDKFNVKLIKDDVLRVLVSKTHLAKVVSSVDIETLDKIENVFLTVVAKRKDMLLEKEKEKSAQVEKQKEVLEFASNLGLTPRQMAEFFSSIKSPKKNNSSKPDDSQSSS